MKRTVIAVASIAVIGLSGAELLHQGFENPDFFAARNSNNYTIAPAGTDGKWCNMTEKLVSDEQAAEGKYSFKMTKQTGKSQHIELALPEFDGPGELEIWFYREPENNFSFALLGNKLADGHIAGLGIWDKSRQYAYYDTAAKKWQRTGLKSPAETWQRVVIRFNADKSKAEVLVGDMDKLEKLAEVTPPAGVPIRRVWFNEHLDAEPGSSVFFDEIKLTTPDSATAGDQ